MPARCISLLEEVKGLLEGQGNKNMNGVRVDDAGAVSTAVSNEVVRTRPVQSQFSPPESTEPRSERIMQNFRSLFSPYPAGPSTSYAGARNQSRPPPAKKRKSFFRVKETWTHEFFCLASTAATCVPSPGSLHVQTKYPYKMQALDVVKSYFSVEHPPLTLKRI